MIGGQDSLTVVHRRDHAYKKPKGSTKKHPRCDVCGRGKSNMAHVGTPASLNVHGSGANRFTYQNMKKAWAGVLTELLEEADLPRPLAAVHATGVCCFPDRTRRDQGNYRFILEKALGDVLTEGGWLEDDDWDRYQFGDLGKTYEAGVAFTAVTLTLALPS